MAKWGEGDPRWIVEERPDATNVNNWHWTEKNACQWSIDKINALLTNLQMDGENVKCLITEVEKCEGEAVAHNRKGKLIFFYEWDLKLKWKGTIEISGDVYESEGGISIPNLSEEYSISEIVVEVSVKSSGHSDDLIRNFIATTGKEIIQKQLGKYVSSLKEEFSKGMILPKKTASTENKDNLDNLSAGFAKQVNMNNKVSKQDGSLKISTISINMDIRFQCRKEEFYNALTNIEMVKAFTNGPVILNPVKGAKFELFGGNIHGEFLELVPESKIVQTWRFKGWPVGHFSEVTIDIIDGDDCTQVKLRQLHVPEGEAEVTKENWTRYYWDPIKRVFGFGAFLV